MNANNWIGSGGCNEKRFKLKFVRKGSVLQQC